MIEVGKRYGLAVIKKLKALQNWEVFSTMNTNTDKWDKRMIQMARLVATWSKDPSTQESLKRP